MISTTTKMQDMKMPGKFKITKDLMLDMLMIIILASALILMARII